MAGSSRAPLDTERRALQQKTGYVKGEQTSADSHADGGQQLAKAQWASVGVLGVHVATTRLRFR